MACKVEMLSSSASLGMAKTSMLFRTEGRSSWGRKPVKWTLLPSLSFSAKAINFLAVSAFSGNDKLDILPVQQVHGPQQHIQSVFPGPPGRQRRK